MLGAFGWGALAASSLVIGAVLALLLHPGKRLIGLVMGFGSGVLIGAIAFDLVEEASGSRPVTVPSSVGRSRGASPSSVGTT